MNFNAFPLTANYDNTGFISQLILVKPSKKQVI